MRREAARKPDDAFNLFSNVKADRYSAFICGY